ncbi:MAG: hypothetical protein ABIJ08_04290 [Nanoarchaeota archaeon]
MNLSKRVVEETVIQVTGKDVVPLVEALKNKKDVSEFKIASEIKKDINQTRNMLYRLYNQNLVSSIRKKDKKKGWYIYYWTLNNNRMKFLATKSKKAYLDRLMSRLEREKTLDFYSCANKCIRLDFEKSTEINFKCPECGNLLHMADNVEIIKKLEKEIKEIKSKIKK